MAVRTLVVACILLLGICTSGKPVEITFGLCKIIWLVGMPADQVNFAIVNQIKSMGSYKLGPVTPELIQAEHSSMEGQVQNVNFTITPSSMGLGCHLEGSSMSAFWYSLFDNGTNYCNLHNIIQGSGLAKAPGFVEFTNEWLCFGLGLSTCK